MTMREARVLFRPSNTAPAMGRRMLEALGDEIGLDTLDDARLLLTELLTNAIRHGGLERDDRISVCIQQEVSGLLVEVADPGGGLGSSVTRHEIGPGSGWGLFLLDRIADDWGIEDRLGGGTVAWFRLKVGSDA